MRRVTVGLAQMDCQLGQVASNIEKMGRFVEQAAAQGVQLLCFPELATTGYNPQLLGDRFAQLALTGDGPELAPLREAAREHDMWLVVPMAERRTLPGLPYNSAVVIDPQGRVAGSYAKAHLFAGERHWFRQGSEVSLFTGDFGTFGVLICYDAGFPELSRRLALAGAELLLLPSAWRVQDRRMWELNIAQRALENTLFFAGVNRVGREGDLHLFGNSQVADPWGRVVAEAPIDEEELLVVQLDLDQVRAARQDIPYLRDRRPDLYGPLVDPI